MISIPALTYGNEVCLVPAQHSAICEIGDGAGRGYGYACTVNRVAKVRPSHLTRISSS